MQFVPVLLPIAFALSWPSFAIIFRVGTSSALAAAPLTMVASAVNLSALGLAFANHGIGFGATLIVLGALQVRARPVALPLLSVSSAAASLAIYLQIVGPPAA